MSAILTPGSAMGLATGLIGALAIVLRAQKEFARDQAIIKSPLGEAVGAGVNARKFRDNDWQAFRALYAAERFRDFYRRFELLLDGHHATIVFTVLTAFAVTNYSVVWLLKPDLPLHGLIGHLYFLGTGWWSLLVHKGAILKGAVEDLRVN